MTDLDGGSAAPISVISRAAPNALPEGEMDALLLGRTRELVAASPGRRNWRGIFIALLVIAAVLGLIVFSIFLLSPEDEGQRVKGRRLTLSDINSSGLKWRKFNGSWLSDTELVYRDPTGGLSILNLENYSIRILMTNSTFRQLNAEKFYISPDLKFVLLSSDHERDSARYHVFEVQTRNKFPLSPKDGARDAPRLQKVVWSPNIHTKQLSNTGGGNGGSVSGGSASNNKITSQAIAFIYENDVYYKPKVQSDLVCRITTTGQDEVLYNGIPNWLYSNTPELLSETLAFSPDGLYLSFFTFNDSLVKEYQYTWVGENTKYPEVKTIRYPKANTVNPNVTVFVVNLTILKFIFPQQIKLPMNIKNGSYVGGMVWVSPTDLSVTFTDREQTSALTVLCRAPSFICKEVHTETIVDNGWVLPTDLPIYSKIQSHFKTINNTESNYINNHSNNSTTAMGQSSARNDSFMEYESDAGGYLLKRLPVRDGEHGYYRHVVFISTTDMRTVPLTMGRFEVTDILGWDEPNEIVYFMSAPEQKPGQRHLYRINLKLNHTEKMNRVYITATQPVCMTCENGPHTFRLAQGLIDANYTGPLPFVGPDDDDEDEEARIPNNCQYNKIYFSSSFSYYVQECLGPDSPSVYLVDTQSNMKIFVLNSGDSLRNRITQFALPQIRTFSVEIRHGFHAQVRLFLPPGMKEEEEIAFPLILNIDAAPDSQLVSDMFYVDWNWYLCSQRSMIVAQIDARGSGYQGELLRSQIKGKLGTLEIEDQLGVLTYLRDNLKFIDPSRICAYGWGYGGYAASMILIEDSQRILQCTVALNPIVSFSIHNSFFTERFFQHNEDYLRALQESDLTMRAGNIESRNFMLVHGTADTIVHQQHSLIMARALIEQGVAFRHQVYTNGDHYLTGLLPHLYKTLELFFDESFGPLDNNEWDPTGFFAFKQ